MNCIKNVSSWTGGGGSPEPVKSHGFTMAEILLSLTIIGVVAAITLPSLTGNINERTWNTQRKALYARFSQAIALMPALNGYGTVNANTDTAAETFVTAGLSKVLKINNICNHEHIQDCGLTEKITTAAGSVISFPHKLSDINLGIINPAGFTLPYSIYDTKVAAFETANGESIAAFYNPNCNVDSYGSTNGNSYAEWFIQGNVCANFIFDLNGNKGPNTVGKDIGVITAIYPVDSAVVSPMPRMKSQGVMEHKFAAKSCTDLNDDYRLPNIEELISIYYNNTVFGIGRAGGGQGTYWSSNQASSTFALAMTDESGRKVRKDRNTKNNVRCVKR